METFDLLHTHELKLKISKQLRFLVKNIFLFLVDLALTPKLPVLVSVSNFDTKALWVSASVSNFDTKALWVSASVSNFLTP